jgi:hypothetical protein
VSAVIPLSTLDESERYTRYCPTTYDQMGCWWFTGEALGPSGVWQDCASDDGDPPGVVDGTTFTQVSHAATL